MASRRPWFICTEVVEKATDFTESALPPADRLRFRLHLLHCADCRRFVEQLRTTADAVHRLGDEPDAEVELPPRLREHLRNLQHQRKDRR